MLSPLAGRSVATPIEVSGLYRQSRLLWEIAALVCLLALCLALRVTNLEALPIFTDEGWYIRPAQIFGASPSFDTWLVSLPYTAPPLFSWLAAPLTRLVSDPLLAGRLASALSGTVALLGVWGTARVLWGPITGLLAAALWALSPFALFYNRIALLDGLVATCGAGALFFAIRFSRHIRMRDAVAMGLCIAAGMLTKIFAASMLLLPLLAVLAAYPAQRRAARRGAVVGVVLGVLPFPCLALANGSGGVASFATHSLLYTGLHHGGVPRMLSIIAGQIGRWSVAMALYITLPVLLLAVLGLWSIRRERIVLLLGIWALVGSLPAILPPLRFLAPRYFVYIVVPIVILAARGLVVFAEAVRARLPPLTPLWLVIPCVAALVLIPSVAADATMMTVPARTPLIAFDRQQYVTGPVAGYPLVPVMAYLRQQEARSRVTLVSPNATPPLYMLILLLYDDPSITLTPVPLGTTPEHGLRAALDRIARGSRGNRVFLLDFNHIVVPKQDVSAHGEVMLPNRVILRLVAHSQSHDPVASYDVYAI